MKLNKLSYQHCEQWQDLIQFLYYIILDRLLLYYINSKTFAEFPINLWVTYSVENILYFFPLATIIQYFCWSLVDHQRETFRLSPLEVGGRQLLPWWLISYCEAQLGVVTFFGLPSHRSLYKHSTLLHSLEVNMKFLPRSLGKRFGYFLNHLKLVICCPNNFCLRVLILILFSP